MRSLDDFHRSVQAVLASKRLGTPVFVRYLLKAPVAAKAVPGFLASVTQAVVTWLGQEPRRLYALGSVKSRHITLTVECAGGACAQVTWSGAASRGPGLDLMLVGNHGVLYHDAGMANAWSSFPELPTDPATKELVAWLERALRTHQPEPWTM